MTSLPKRDTFRLTCRKCGRSMQLVRKMLGASQDTTVDECALCDEERASAHPEFARGMRRAVEIAEGLSAQWHRNGGTRETYWEKLKEAVEKELK